MAIGVTKQQNIAINPARHLIFFEGTNVCYNYKTQQWSRIPAYDGLGVYSVNAKGSLFGLVRFSGNAVDLQTQSVNFVAQTATLTTTAKEPNPEGKGTVQAVRPRSNGGTHAFRVGVQEDEDAAVSWVTGSSLNSRSLASHFRGQASAPSGRFVRIEDTITGGFTSVSGADIKVSGSSGL